jgi:hypothetical protein
MKLKDLSTLLSLASNSTITQALKFLRAPEKQSAGHVRSHTLGKHINPSEGSTAEPKKQGNVTIRRSAGVIRSRLR